MLTLAQESCLLVEIMHHYFSNFFKNFRKKIEGTLLKQPSAFLRTSSIQHNEDKLLSEFKSIKLLTLQG